MLEKVLKSFHVWIEMYLLSFELLYNLHNSSAWDRQACVCVLRVSLAAFWHYVYQLLFVDCIWQLLKCHFALVPRFHPATVRPKPGTDIRFTHYAFSTDTWLCLSEVFSISFTSHSVLRLPECFVFFLPVLLLLFGADVVFCKNVQRDLVFLQLPAISTVRILCQQTML